MGFRVGIIRLSALGDVIISAAFLGFLGEVKRAILDAKDSKLESSGNFSCESLQIEWFVDKRFSAILENSPVIDRLHVLDFKGSLKSFSGLLALRKYMKECGKYDIVIDMQGLIKSSLVGKMLDSRTFVGFSWRGARESAASFFYSRRVDISYHANILERNFSLILESLSVLKLDSILKSMDVTFATPDRNALNNELLSFAINLRKNGFSFNLENLDSNLKAKLDSKNFKILFVLEASIKEKIYPANKFIELAKLIQNYKKATFFLAFKDNKDSANFIESNLKNENINCEKLENLSFNELKFALSKMDCVIGGDTGLTYLAWAFGVLTITLYGNKDSKNLQNLDSIESRSQDSNNLENLDSKNTKNIESNLQNNAKISNKNSKKNMRNTHLNRILLGNPYIVSNSNTFEIESIPPQEIFNIFKTQISKKFNLNLSI
ncbi:lipopolysaccharide heptosyltransferase I [Helicobacter saguini]|uniref:Lipopolysaccharide heptosyltransferase 1 n=1 Tax=Helicobacter saguini TaxID=1548018 RepID=A0A347VYS0_9HELI|nr:lipopolysaccharide heptosyltransferase I [Helicobacter saguini]MWV61089.1 lipopolysaccharide heptosyltransferase I [Helicobacter saguini]MWV68242.1 lipopolysaccharide heptosyltransferase I [Helicobacter saguini]MWV70294.1 lipopolysaccharide heptosyltransferase I [Helicobacter saguini]MWV72196.1 lipopolysaccharide heptosyltransferase I [Helicobacter saguini]TLD95250.1 lipopolysaccharide heptosyltransferase I [Helicobacter saguini]